MALNGTNISWVYVDLLDLVGTLNKASIGLSLIITPLILVFNILLLIVIVTSSKLRWSLRYMVVISIALCDILIGTLGLPLETDFLIQREVTVKCQVHIVIQVLVTYGHVTITLYGLFIITGHYVIQQCNIRHDIHTTIQRILNMVISCLPWIVAILILSPTLPNGVYEDIKFLWTDNFCPMDLKRWATRVLLSLSYYLPAFLITILCGLIIRRWYHEVYVTPEMQPRLLNGETSILQPKFIIIINTVSILLILPLYLIETCEIILKDADIQLLFTMLLIAMQMAMFKSAMLPCLWLYTPEVKTELVQKFRRLRCWRRGDPTLQHVVNKTYVDFKEDETKQEKSSSYA